MTTSHSSLLFVLALLALPNCSLAQEAATASAADIPPAQSEEDTYRQLQMFGEAFERVREKYVEPVTDEQLVEYAIKGMLSNLDPHSDYLTAKDFDDMKVQTKGEFGGLGIEVTMDQGVVKVVSPIDDTPAFKAGVKAGDLITHLDGKPILGMTLNDAVEKMRGKVGTPIEITIRREGVAEPIIMSIVRDTIKIQPVKFRVEQDSIGYIRVTQFNRNTYDGLKKAIDSISKDTGDKLIGYVIDLRNNPGGLLDQAIAVSDAFLEQGEIVSTRGREEKDIKRDNALPGDLAGGLPIVVLINNGSASASEIVAGALQDHHRAVIMGTRSFGKGSVQTVIPISGDGALRLTTARYFTPSGRSIQGKGIDPDITVEMAKVEKLSEMGFHEEDLKGALSNPNGEQKPSQPAPANDNEIGDKKDGKDADQQSETDKDYQLSRALDLLKGLSLMKDGSK
ncbi:MAG TPA: S41 family peptidase [Alphaproteobacteria bacterium]|nr:S41 family peptidase [Alphaproteobacteria bacterium]HNS44671.1 S41 family peptidase [Alphaproteobacteria bacterium]